MENRKFDTIPSLETDKEEIEQLKKFYSSDINFTKTFGEELSIRDEALKLEGELEEKQSNASWVDKSLAWGHTYNRGTIIGSIAEAVGITNYIPNASEFAPMEGYNVSFDAVEPILQKYNTNDDETKRIFESVSPQHLQANIEALVKNREIDTFVNQSLTQTEQKLAHISTILDVDLAIPLGSAVAGGRGVLAMSKTGKQVLAGTVATISGSKPILVNETFDGGKTWKELSLEAMLYGGMEYVAMMKLTPEIKIKAIDEVSESLVAKQMAGRSGVLIHNTEDMGVQVQRWNDKPFDIIDDASIITIPRASAETTDMIEKSLPQLVDKELVNIAGEQFNKAGVKSTIAGYAHASNDIDDMLKQVQRHIIENPQDSIGVLKAVTALRSEIDNFIQGVKSIDGLTPDELLKIEKSARSALDSFENGTVLKSPKSSLDTVKEIIAKVKTGGDDAIRQYGKSAKIDKLLETVSKVKTEIEKLSKNTKLSDKERRLKITKKEKKLKQTEESLSKSRENAVKEIENKLYDELNDGIRLKRDGNNYLFGNKVIPAAIVLGALSTGAFAKSDDGSAGDVFLTSVQSIIMLGVLAGVGVQGYKAYSRATKARIDIVPSQTGRIQQEASKASKMMNALKGNYEFVRTSFTETFNPLMEMAKREKNIPLIKFIENILVNPLMGKSQVGEYSKNRIMSLFHIEYRQAETELFRKWFSVQPNKEDTMSWFEAFHGTNLNKFRHYVTSMKDGVGEVPEAGKEFIEQMAKKSTDIIEKHGIEKAKELGLDGAEAVRMLDEYVRRNYKNGFQNILRTMDEDSLVAVKNKFKEMYLSSVSGAIKSVTGANDKVSKMFSKFKSIDEYKQMLKDNESVFKEVTEFDDEAQKLLDDAMSHNELADAQVAYTKFSSYVNEMLTDEKATLKIDKYFDRLMQDGFRGGVADVASQFKNRVPFDLKLFKDIPIKIQGSDDVLTIDRIFERNDFALTNSYMNNMSGRMALKKAGYSVEDAKLLISEIKDTRAKEIAGKVLDSMIGIPLIKADENLLAVMQIVGNSSVAMALPMVAFSFLQEFGMLAGKLVFNPKERQMVLGNIVDIIRGHGEDSCMVEFMKKRVGLGVSSDVGNIGSRFDVDMREAGIFEAEGNTAVNISRTARDAVFKYSGMLKFSDILETSNAVANIQRLAEIAYGSKKINPALAKKYGLTISDLELAKKSLSFNSKGHVKVPDYSMLSHLEQDRMSNILWNMGQVGAQKSTMGGTGMWTRDNVFGSAMSKLLMYPMNSFANIGLHQVRSLAHGDVETSVSALFGYTGSYVGAKLRDGLLGREKEEEEYHLYALMNMPMLAPISLAKGLSNPAFFKFPKEVFTDMSLVLSGAVGHD